MALKIFTYIRHGRGKSINAMAAEEAGRYPITTAKTIVRTALIEKGIKTTYKEAETLLIKVFDGEWHHTGKHGMRTGYYDTKKAIALGVKKK